jgi:hypothetical protein
VVTQWNINASSAIFAAGPTAHASTLSFAMVQGAVYDAATPLPGASGRGPPAGMSGGYTSAAHHQSTPTCNSGGGPAGPTHPAHRRRATTYRAQVFWYSGPSPPSGVVRRPPLAVIAPHWTQFV